MKTILVPTDFSEPAENAAEYAMHISKALKANIHFCHAFKVPSDVPGSAHIVWPLYEHAEIEDDCNRNLAFLAKKMTQKEKGFSTADSFHPVIRSSFDEGSPFQIINKTAKDNHTSFTIMGMNGLGAIERFLLGSTSLRMIDKTKSPLLLVPDEYVFKGIRKIAFATDLNKGDIEAIRSIAGFAQYFDADLVITHVLRAGEKAGRHEKHSEEFLNELTGEINYDKIYYKSVNNSTVGQGLDWFSEFGHVDLLVMIHREHGFLDRLFKGSFTKAQASRTPMPLMVLPEGKHIVF